MRPVYEPGVSRNLISTNVPNPLTQLWFNQKPYPKTFKTESTFFLIKFGFSKTGSRRVATQIFKTDQFGNIQNILSLIFQNQNLKLSV